jgi:hypothetical protein
MAGLGRRKAVEARSEMEDGQRSPPMPEMGETYAGMGEMGRRKWENVNLRCRRPKYAGRSRKRGENGRNGGNGSPDLEERNFRSCSMGGNFSFDGKMRKCLVFSK